MQLSITGRKINVSQWIKDYAEEKIGGAARVFDIDPLTIEVVLTHEKNPANPTPFKCEVTMRAAGHVIHVEENEEEVHAAIDVASAKVTRQLRKYKTRITEKRIRTAERDAQASHSAGSELDLDALMEDLTRDEIVREKLVTVDEISEDEAAIRFDLLGHDFYLYRDEDGKAAVMYKRNDGGLGVVKEK